MVSRFRRYTGISTLVFVFGLPLNAALAAEPSAYRSWYAGLGLGVSLPANINARGAATGKIETGAGLAGPSLFVGYRPQALSTAHGAFRFELELTNRISGIDKVTSGGVTSKPNAALVVGATLINVAYDFNTGSAFKPYLGFGVGIASAEFSKLPGLGITRKETRDSVPVIQTKLGVSWEMSPASSWFAGYTLLAATKGFEFDAGSKRVAFDRTTSHGIEFGYRYHF